jgi:hypothetical protein
LGLGAVSGISGAGRGLETKRSASSSQRDPSGCASQATSGQHRWFWQHQKPATVVPSHSGAGAGQNVLRYCGAILGR